MQGARRGGPAQRVGVHGGAGGGHPAVLLTGALLRLHLLPQQEHHHPLQQPHRPPPLRGTCSGGEICYKEISKLKLFSEDI